MFVEFPVFTWKHPLYYKVYICICLKLGFLGEETEIGIHLQVICSEKPYGRNQKGREGGKTGQEKEPCMDVVLTRHRLYADPSGSPDCTQARFSLRQGCLTFVPVCY